MAEKRPGNSQGLSRVALAAKRARDLSAAKTIKRRNRKAENQRIGQESDSDLHHTKSGVVKRVSIAYNRATHDRNEVNT
tara:strand:+ start:294 stop:530 length:237 start_codon:yes stop_codon:yes gene_type:complete